MTRERGEQAVSEDEREKLERLAKAAESKTWTSVQDCPCDETWAHHRPNDAAFVAACPPDSILRLLTEMNRLRDELDRTKAYAADMAPLLTMTEDFYAGLGEFRPSAGAYKAELDAQQRADRARLLAEIARLENAFANLQVNFHEVIGKEAKRAAAAEARVQALEGALKAVVEHARPAFAHSPFRRSLDAAKAALAPSQGAGE